METLATEMGVGMETAAVVVTTDSKAVSVGDETLSVHCLVVSLLVARVMLVTGVQSEHHHVVGGLAYSDPMGKVQAS